MGKIGNKGEVEIIPISDVNPLDHCTVEHATSPSQDRAKMQRIPYMSDPSIVPRVQKYLETNVDKTYVNIEQMADDLQRKYREYAKRKRSAFRASVKKAYAIVLQSYGLEEQGVSSSEDEEISDGSSTNSKLHSNSMNNQLIDLYSRSQMPKKIDENELIDISSDDSEDNQKTSNGPSTSVRNDYASVEPYQNNNFAKEATSTKNDKYASSTPVNDRGKKRKVDSTVMNYLNANKKKKFIGGTQGKDKMLQEQSVTFKDVGGMDKVLEEVCKLLIHVRHPEVYRQIGISPPRGFLLHGPPGCGKTLLAHAIAGELGVPLIKVAAPELVAGVSGESEERIRDLFDRALSTAPCVLFLDEIDAITPNRQFAQKEMERRIVAQLLSCLDDLNKEEKADRVLVIGATNRPDSIDPALRRAGRFDREISLGIPDVNARRDILKVLTGKLKLEDDFDFVSLAKYTPGYVGADLMSLTREAAMAAVNRMFAVIKKDRALKKQKEMPAAAPIEEKKPVTPEEKEKTEENASDTSKSEIDIIVDDDTKEVAGGSNGDTSKTSQDILIIDDEKENTQEHKEEEEKKADEDADDTLLIDVTGVSQNTEETPVSPLMELLGWLHNKNPLSGEELSSLSISMEDFAKALKNVQPSAKREGFATVPDVTWNDVGSLADIREELQMTILAPVRHAEQFSALGLQVPAGVLLCGPPGCGKTLLAKAIANEAGVNFISVKGPELLNMYVGESERAVRVCFERARNSAPCVIFFDELDALCPKRSDSREGGATMRVVNQMLTEMDGVEGRNGVFLLAASNRPDIIDPAVLRPGRLDKILFVGLPSASDRVEILRTITKNGTRPPLSSEVDLEIIGKSEECDGYTGADLAALVREAGVVALKEYMIHGDPTLPMLVTTDHFKKAVKKIRPSVTEKDQKHYDKLRRMYSAMNDQDDDEKMELA